MRNIIIYVGGFGLPNRTASAQRALENANLFKSLGYKPIVMGKIDLPGKQSDDSITTCCNISDIDCYDIRHPDKNGEYTSYVSNIESIKRVIQLEGKDKVYAIVAYNYPSIALHKLIKYAKKNNIKMIAECTEWYGIEGRNIIRNIQRFWQTEYRMRYLAKKARNIICASSHLQKYYSEYNTVRLPFVVDGSADKWHVNAHRKGGTTRRFIYAGSPGMRLVKDYVHWVIEAFALVKQAGYTFEFVIVGITQQQLLQSAPQLQDMFEVLGGEIKFLGRLSHEETIKSIRQSDYFVFLRPQNRTSNVGFPTKLVEAFSCGIPIITNDTSDICMYVQTGKNGFLLQYPDKQELRSVLIDAIEMDSAKLLQMKNECQANNPFCFENYKDSVREFLLSAK